MYYRPVIDSDKCWEDSDVSMMKKLPERILLMFPLIKLAGNPQLTNKDYSCLHINSSCQILLVEKEKEEEEEDEAVEVG